MSNHEIEHRKWFGPTCVHGSTPWEGAMPTCEWRGCLWRWWLRYGLPTIAVLVAVVVIGLAYGDGFPSCPPGWHDDGLGYCSRL